MGAWKKQAMQPKGKRTRRENAEQRRYYPLNRKHENSKNKAD